MLTGAFAVYFERFLMQGLSAILIDVGRNAFMKVGRLTIFQHRSAKFKGA